MKKKKVKDNFSDFKKGKYKPEENRNRYCTVTKDGVTRTVYLDPRAYDDNGHDRYPDT